MIIAKKIFCDMATTLKALCHPFLNVGTVLIFDYLKSLHIEEVGRKLPNFFNPIVVILLLQLDVDGLCLLKHV